MFFSRNYLQSSHPSTKHKSELTSFACDNYSIVKFESFYSWFPAAEQAINTIYVLGENPDVICGKILTAVATTSMQSWGKDASASTTAQRDLASVFLLAGHIAVRPI